MWFLKSLQHYAIKNFNGIIALQHLIYVLCLKKICTEHKLNALNLQQENLINSVLKLADALKSEFSNNNTTMNILGYKIIKRGNKYCTRIRINGKQKFLSADTTKELTTKIKLSAKLKTNCDNQKRFCEWWHEYLDLYKVGQVKQSTLNSYHSVYKCHLSKLSNLNLQNISIYHCNDIVKSISGTRQKQKVFDTLKECLQKATDLELIKKNPCKLLPRPKHTKTRINALTHEQQKLFIETMQNDKCCDYFMFLLLTGVRRGEALAVTRADIDFENMKIKINKTLSAGEIGTTKTPRSTRVIPIFNQLLDKVLFKYKDLQPEQRLFPFTNNIIDKHFYAICRKCELAELSLHSFRHTFASICFEIGIPALQIKEWLGHKDILTTQQIYIHLMDTTSKKYLDIANNFDFIATQSATQNGLKA